jgi:hypothetical protein
MTINMEESVAINTGTLKIIDILRELHDLHKPFKNLGAGPAVGTVYR